MAYSQIADDDFLRSVAFSSISGTYTKLGSAFTHPARLVTCKNNTDGDMFITHTNGDTPLSDGTQDKWFMPAGSFELRDVASNKADQPPSVLMYQSGRQFWVRQSSAPTKNSVYLQVMFGVGET